MKNSSIYYSVGALLYTPANNRNIAASIRYEKLLAPFSLALCLEDTIPDAALLDAEEALVDSLLEIHTAIQSEQFYLPKIFIRVRSAAQISTLWKRLGTASELVTGFIFPKFSLSNADMYFNAISLLQRNAPVYIMPIYESHELIDLRSRYDVLYGLKDKLDAFGPSVLNLRVGGNDLCHLFGFRRHADECIHDIPVIHSLFADIMTVYGTDYVLSAPVWEYFRGTNWESGLRKELSADIYSGFVGKTAIHPLQVPIIHESFKVDAADYHDACSILNWDEQSSSLVSSSNNQERMNERNTHTNWAQKILYLAEVYGVRENAEHQDS